MSHENRFCIIPWVHTHITPQGERKTCCVADVPPSTNFTAQTLDEFWNSDYLCKIRQFFLNGNIPPQCQKCFNTLLTNQTYNIIYNKKYRAIKHQLLLATRNDGFLSIPPRSFDYRISNLCNFSCKMCGDKSSSKWEYINKKNNHYNVSSAYHYWVKPKTCVEITRFQDNIVQSELLAAISRNEVDEIYWAGGEPLLWDFHWKVIEYAVKQNVSSNIELKYNTNLSTISYQDKCITEYFVNYKKITIQVSMDATRDAAEYLRTGLNWNVWLNNLKTIKNSSNKHIFIELDVTLTLIGLIFFKDILKLSKKMNLFINIRLVNTEKQTNMLSPLILPEHLFIRLIDDILKIIWQDPSPNNIDLLRFFKSLKKLTLFQDCWGRTYPARLKQAKIDLQQLEKLLQEPIGIEDIIREDSEVYHWWKSI